MKTSDIIELVREKKLIAILRDVKKDKLIPVAEALYNGGVRLLEVTYCSDKSRSDEEIAANIKLLSDTFKGKLVIGAGTVLTVSQVKLTAENGGRFIISPNVDTDVIKETVKKDMVSIPGAVTPSEIVTASDCGAHFVKLFPATSFGPAYVKAVRAPIKHIELLAVGGIDENNMADYLEVGITGFGVGSNILDRKAIANNDFEVITKLAEKYVSRLK